MRVFPLRTGQISQFPFRRLPWNNNVALNGFVIYSNSCLFLFGNPFYPRKCHSQMYECRNDPSTNKCLPICSNAMKWMWMKLGWIFAETSSWAKVWYLSWWDSGNLLVFCCCFLKKTSIPEVGVTMVEARPLMPGLVPEWAIVGRPVICCGRKYCFWGVKYIILKFGGGLGNIKNVIRPGRCFFFSVHLGDVGGRRGGCN